LVFNVFNFKGTAMADEPQSLDEPRLQRLAEMLDQQTTWPADYLFKFIVPVNEVDEVKALFLNEALTMRESRTGKYVSVSVNQRVASSAEVVAFYRCAAKIKGLISL